MLGRREGGFTLVELMVVVTIIGVLTAVAVASFTMNSTRSQKVACQSNQHTLTTSITAYALANDGHKPDDLADLEPYVRTYAKVSRCPVDGRALVYDEAVGCVRCTYPDHDE